MRILFTTVFIVSLAQLEAQGRQPVLSVSPVNVNVETTVGSNAPAQTVHISNNGNGALKWTVGNPNQSWLFVSPRKGTNSGTLTLTFQTSVLQPGEHTASFVVSATSSQPPTAPVNVRVIVGETQPPPPTDGRGPSDTLPCPAGAVSILPGQESTIGSASFPAGTVYCLIGTFNPTTSIRPKAGDVLHGQYPATINGVNVQSGDGLGTSVISGWNCTNCANASVRNLTIRGRDTINCVGAFGPNAGNWTIERNHISGCRWGVNHGMAYQHSPRVYVTGPRIVGNILVDNVWPGGSSSDGSGNYGIQNATGTLIENNEISRGGGQAKVTTSMNTTMRGNFVHHNLFAGLWNDGDNLNVLVEKNVVEDNCGDGIFHEISAGAVIQNNVIKRNGHNCAGSGIYVSTSRQVQVLNNELENNFRDVNLFVNCEVTRSIQYPGAIEYDLRDNMVRDNIIRVGGPQGTVWGSSFSTGGSCTAAEIALYTDPNGGKNNWYESNDYVVSSLTGTWWFWNGFKTWTQWQALGQDTAGTVGQR